MSHMLLMYHCSFTMSRRQNRRKNPQRQTRNHSRCCLRSHRICFLPHAAAATCGLTGPHPSRPRFILIPTTTSCACAPATFPPFHTPRSHRLRAKTHSRQVSRQQNSAAPPPLLLRAAMGVHSQLAVCCSAHSSSALRAPHGRPFEPGALSPPIVLAAASTNRAPAHYLRTERRVFHPRGLVARGLLFSKRVALCDVFVAV
jgi:hypothetical protein